MADYKLRSLDAGTGTGRTTIRLDVETWAAVDMIAARSGIKWSEWARDVLAMNPDAPNATAVIRNAAVNALMTESFLNGLEERGLDLEKMDRNALMRNSAQITEDTFTELMKTATVDGEVDMGGFTLLFGYDESGQDTVWIRNNLRDGLHFAFTAPHPTSKKKKS